MSEAGMTHRQRPAPLVVVAATTVIASTMLLGACRGDRGAERTVEGQVEGREISVSPRIPARVTRLAVSEGDTVAEGELIAVLDAPAITAVTEQTQALAEATRAQSEAAEQFRPERVAAARALWEQARIAASNAADSYRRMQILHDSGVVSREELKLAQTAASAAEAQLRVTRSHYDLLRAGPRPETRRALEALGRQADASERGSGAVRSDTVVAAPARGIVQEVLVEAGETALPGTPIVMLRDPDRSWVTVTVPETRLGQLAVGSPLTGRIPSLGGREVAFRVTYVAPMAGFATQRPTSASGGFDVRQFELRAEPVGDVAGLRPGMTVLFQWPT